MEISKKCDCQCNGSCEPNKKEEKTLTITWQRLISDGITCPRCGSTENELEKAVKLLNETLHPLGIKVELEKSELTLDEFKKDPTKSNIILFNNIPLEDLIEAKIGQSQCCDVCGDEECRTIEIDKKSYEKIPAEMIVKAGMIMGLKIIDQL